MAAAGTALKQTTKKTAKQTARIEPESYPTPPDAHIVSEYYSEPPDTLCAARRARIDVPP